MSEPMLSRRDELLSDGALAWLDGADVAAFEAVLRDDAARAEFEALERAAAVTSYALVEPVAEEQRLLRLTAKLHADALAFLAARTRDGAERDARARRWRRRAPWLIAAAALSFAVWPGDAAPSPAAARERLLQRGSPVVTCGWEPGPSPRAAGVHGDVVWDPVRQEGFLRLRGLPDPGAGHRYQLWIVDAGREGPPIDGGLLPRASGGETIAPVAARLPVHRAAAFVLTTETADGVVVSAQQDVVAIARP